MESELLTGSVALETVRSVRERAAGRSRAFAWLLLWGAALMSAYAGVWLFVNASGPSSSPGWVTTSLLLPTILLDSLLIQGARERFSGRLRFRGVAVGAVVAVVLLVFVGLGGLALFGSGYPRWVAPIVAVAGFALLGAKPALFLLRHRATAHVGDPWISTPLDRPARRLTIAIGVYFGLAVALAQSPIAVSLLTIAGMIFFVVSASAPHARWSVGRAGYEWGRLHWIACGLTFGAVYLFCLVASLTGTPAGAVAVACGILVSIPLFVAAFLPRPR